VSDFCFFDQHISLLEFQSSFCSKRVHGCGGGSGDHNAQEFLEEVQQFFSFLFDAKCFFGVIESLANPEPQSHRASWVLDLLWRGACGCGCWRPGGASAGGAAHMTRTATLK